MKSIISLLFVFAAQLTFGQFEPLTQNPKAYLLTCSPGNEVYSAYGHSALAIISKSRDEIYNYGTFDFNTDNFTLKFAQGKLPYALDIQKFGQFQWEYLQDGRQIMAQELALDSAEISSLAALLRENAKEENKFYKYDFFYDNCATRIKDILDLATNSSIEWNLKPSNKTFRNATDVYLKDMKWTDLGIDIALGLPCDRTMQPGQEAFLPDSLFGVFKKAQLSGKPLVKREVEILPSEELELKAKWYESPLLVLSLISAFFMVLIFINRNRKAGRLTAKFLILLNGVIGLAVFLLWFFTDHTATANNLNLLWANPLNIILPFAFGFKKKWIKLYAGILLILLILWGFLPQDLNESLLPLVVLFLASTVHLIRTSK